MANEAVLVYEEELPLPCIVSNSVGIEKGALLKLVDPNTASAATGTNDVLAGIAAQEKIASDGKTKLAVYRKGIFKMIASGAISVGEPVGSVASWANYVISNALTPNLSGMKCLGHALETAADGETILIKVNVQNK